MSHKRHIYWADDDGDDDALSCVLRLSSCTKSQSKSEPTKTDNDHALIKDRNKEQWQRDGKKEEGKKK